MIGVSWVWAFLDTPTSDADASEAFWQRVTRTTTSARRGARDEFATLLPRHGDPWVKLQRVLEGGGVHLDLDVEVPLDEASAEAVRLGATEVHRERDVIVMRSPAGFTFCLPSWRNAGSATSQVRDGEPDLLDQVCLDIPAEAYAREVDFWESLTSWPTRPGSLPEFVSLTRPDGIPVRLLFQRLGEAILDQGQVVDPVPGTEHPVPERAARVLQGVPGGGEGHRRGVHRAGEGDPDDDPREHGRVGEDLARTTTRKVRIELGHAD